MSFSENTNGNGMVMPVSPMGGYGAGNGGFGGGNAGTNGEIQRGFDQQSVMGGVTGINSAVVNGFSGVNQALCNGFAGVNTALNSGFAAAEASANARQMADMQQNFAAQAASTAGMNNIASNLATCCCENRAAVADLKYTVANLAASQNAQTASILTDNLAQTQALAQYLAPTPRPAYMVQNPNCCAATGWNTCGCGM